GKLARTGSGATPVKEAAAVIILGLCVWNYWYLLLETNDGIPRIFKPVLREAGIAPGGESEVRVGVYESAATGRFFREMRFDYTGVLDSWERFLRQLGYSHKTFGRIDRIDEFDLLVLPFTSCLSDYEADRIKDFLARGGAVFLSGAVGSRFEDGAWRDEPVFGDIIGARFAGNANPGPRGAARLTLARDLPVSLRWTPRGVLEIPSYNQVLVVRPIGGRMSVVATAPFFRDEETFDELSAFCIGSYLKGRVAWSGFRLGAFPPGDETAERAFRELFTNTIAWLTDRPRVTTPQWPDGKTAALGLVVDAAPGEAPRLLSRLREEGLPVGVLVTPREAREFAALHGLDSSDVEWILHIDRDHRAGRRASPDDWLVLMRKRMERVLGRPVKGLLHEDVRTRSAAETALAAGFDYLLAPPADGIEQYPEIYASRRPKGPFEPPEALSLAPYRTTLPGGVAPTDCFFVVLPGAGFLELDDPLAFAGERREDLWVAHPSDLVAWRSDRNSVVMNEEFLSSDRLRLRISNGSYSEFTDFPFSIRFREAVEGISVWPKAVGQPPPELVSREGDSWTFAIRRFRPGVTLEFIFTPRKKDRG
ncbi:MAG: hypothetical protein ACLFRP_01330, partial [Puniceicoccaceae bacterium]